MAYNEAEIEDLIGYLTPEERKQLEALMAAPTLPWEPFKGPQTLANDSDADIIGFGGAAGGGKTDLACGKAITQHQKVMILRKIGTELSGVIDRLTELIGKDGYNGQDKIWRTLRYDNKPLQIELGAVPNLGDEKKYQGRPHDLLVFDEAANFLEIQVRFLLGWLRSSDPNQKCQALFTFNPPTNIEGRWIIPFFGPWIDKDFVGKKSAPGELRFAAMIPTDNGSAKDIWVDSPEPFVIVGKERVYDFDPTEFGQTEIIKPLARTFIPSRVTDNPVYMGTGYVSVLQAMPEPLRSQMLNGDFSAGIEDDPWQVIPTAWVEAAMKRWKREGGDGKVMDSVGVDVARGGKDYTEIARRHGTWFDEPVSHPGDQTPDGPKTAGLVVAQVRDRARIHIDVIGVGSSPYDHLVGLEMDVIGVNVSEKPTAKSKQGNLQFFNLRSQLWWQMREALDPANRQPIALPPDDTLKNELCTPKWEMRGVKVYVQSREDIIKAIGKSPDRATAYIQALMDTPLSPSNLIHSESEQQIREDRTGYDPYA